MSLRGGGSRTGPTDDDVLAACVTEKTAHPEYGVKRVFAAMLAAHPDWGVPPGALKERHVQKVMKKHHGLTRLPAATNTGAAAASSAVSASGGVTSADPGDPALYPEDRMSSARQPMKAPAKSKASEELKKNLSDLPAPHALEEHTDVLPVAFVKKKLPSATSSELDKVVASGPTTLDAKLTEVAQAEDTRAKKHAKSPPEKHRVEVADWLETKLVTAAVEHAAAVQLAKAGWAHLEEGSELARSLKMPFDAACSLQRQVLTKKVIETRTKLCGKGPAILQSFTRDGVLEASRKFELPPLQVFDRCLQQLGMSAKEAQMALNNPKQLSVDLLRQFQSARSADGVTETHDQSARTSELAVAFESAVGTRLSRTGVLFFTEDQQKKSKASKAGVRLDPTPDFLIDLDADFVVGGARVCWIEVKNYFGSALGYHRQQLLKQLANYQRLYGTGAVIFRFGAGESIRQILPPGVLVLASPTGGYP